jgi:hypothetical protein
MSFFTVDHPCNSAKRPAASCLLGVDTCEHVHEVLLRVMHMLDPPARMMEPAVLGRVVRHLLTAPFRPKAGTDGVRAATLLSGSSSSSKDTSSAGAAADQAVAAVRSSARGSGRFDMVVNI